MQTSNKAKLEAALFVSGDPLSESKLMEILGLSLLQLTAVAAELASDMAKEERGIMLVKVAGGYQLCTKPELATTLEKLAQVAERRLSAPALETLAIIAFKQPITKLEIEEIRGVKIDRVLTRLLEYDLVKEIGRKQVLGRPILYATTDEFLRCFGLADITELPSLPEAGKFFDEVSRQVEANFKAE